MNTGLETMNTALALAKAYRRDQRRLVLVGADAYSRERDLPHWAPSFGTRPGLPFTRLRPGARNDMPATTLAIIADLAYRLRFARRGHCRITERAIKACLIGEARTLRRQRAAVIAQALTGAGYTMVGE